MIKIGLIERRAHGTDKLLKVFYEDENGQKQGCYVEFYPGTDKHLNIQRYVDNRRNGRSFIIDPNEDISSIIYYKNDLRHGASKHFFKHIKPSEVYSYLQFDAVEGERIELW
jgi:antitoxin component YwqK of YwqJK toxin-antitoxin module